MRFKGILLDLDNTLYSYAPCHAVALTHVVDHIATRFGLAKPVIFDAYDRAKSFVQVQLGQTASAHSRLLYFQKLCELLDLSPLENSLAFQSLYWDRFLDEMKLHDGALDIIKGAVPNLCYVTDLTAEIQFRKIQKLGLHAVPSHLVTSEEAGADKPNPAIFWMALQKLRLRPEDVCMIGDDYEKDIVGASLLGIKSFLFTGNFSEIHRQIYG